MKLPDNEVLRNVVAAVKPAYEIPHDDLVGEVLIPAMRCAQDVLIGAGFFSSRCLAQIAPGLAALLQNPLSKMRLLVSPALSSEDRAAIQAGVSDAESVMNAAVIDLLLQARMSGVAIEIHCLNCLSYLVALKAAGDSIRTDGCRNVPQEEMAYKTGSRLVGRPWFRKCHA